MPLPEYELVGPIIAERKLTLHVTETEVQDIVIRMAAPIREDENCYHCHWQIAAPDYRRALYAAGLDGFQAIHLATKMIGINLSCLAKETGHRFRWEDSDNIGFPDFSPDLKNVGT